MTRRPSGSSRKPTQSESRDCWRVSARWRRSRRRCGLSPQRGAKRRSRGGSWRCAPICRKSFVPWSRSHRLVGPLRESPPSVARLRHDDGSLQPPELHDPRLDDAFRAGEESARKRGIQGAPTHVGVQLLAIHLVCLLDAVECRPSKTVYFVNHPTELGMTLVGGIYYSNQHFPHVPAMLTIAGNDSCGGAGIPADIKTASALGVYAAACITAVTVQNTKGVSKLIMMEGNDVKLQVESVCSDMHLDAVKIGMTGTRDIIDAITAVIQEYHLKNVVLDPVMAASR